MLPSEHFIVAFVPVLVYVGVRDREFPSPRLIGIVFVGSQFPDLIDKPLAHEVALLPSGRVFMHSLPFAIPIIVLVSLYGWRTRRLRASSIFGFSYLTHLLADNYRAFIRPNPQIPPDLLWPFRPPKPRPLVPHWAGDNLINIHLWTGFSVIVLSSLAYFLILDLRTEFGPGPH